jgi:hypothetical protein
VTGKGGRFELTRVFSEPCQVVPSTYAGSFIGINVVVAKVPRKTAASVYIASSVILLSDADKRVDEFATHNVMAESSLELLAHAIAFQFASMRFHMTIGSWPK